MNNEVLLVVSFLTAMSQDTSVCSTLGTVFCGVDALYKFTFYLLAYFERISVTVYC